MAKVTPSVCAECSKGVSLVAFGDRATATDREFVLSIFGRICRPVEIEEKDFELLADLTSCAPAFISTLMREFALSATRRGDISPELAELLVKETLLGTAELINKAAGFEEVVERVATKGGITEEGVKVIRKAAPAMYDDLLEVTLAKHNLVKEKLKDQAQ